MQRQGWRGLRCALTCGFVPSASRVITRTVCSSYYYSLKHVARFRWGVFGCALGVRASHSLLVLLAWRVAFNALLL